MRSRALVAISFILLLIGAFVIVRDAQRTAAGMRVQGRLRQLHLALFNYQAVNGVIPDRNLHDSNGRLLCSWVGMILPFIEQHEIADSIDISESWDSPSNKESLERGKRFWDWYSADGYFISAYDGADSMWDSNGKPLGTLEELPTKVLLVATTIDGIHPLEPFCLTEDHLRKILTAGTRAWYVDADRFHGTVRLEGNSIVFVRNFEQ